MHVIELLDLEGPELWLERVNRGAESGPSDTELLGVQGDLGVTAGMGLGDDVPVPSAPRPRDLSFEALVEVTGATVASERGAINMALKQIRETSSEHSDVELASEIRYRAKTYRE